MIIATAGHIDHGKTTLVQAITGHCTDRLPEEKRRGISIELGFAHWPAPDQAAREAEPYAPARLWSFVDVPGHERFVRHMIAGVQRIDAVLMVVAADDGIMPQTREHAEILSMLGHHDWVVALTKIDRVDSDRLQAVRAELAAWLDDLGLSVPLVEVDAPRGSGVAKLVDVLARIHAKRRSASAVDSRFFRMAVDRSFVVTGEGLVVTGTVLAGCIERDQRLVVSPSGLAVRVRAIRMAGQSSDRAVAGQRCALNVSGAGVERGSVDRGDWLLDPTIHGPTACVDVAIRWLNPAGSVRRVFTGHVHAGTSLLSAQISPLEHDPGHASSLTGLSLASQRHAPSTLARVHLQTETCAAIGDRWIIRSADAARTLGVAQVLLPSPRLTGQRGAAHAQSLRAIERVLGNLAVGQRDWAQCAAEALLDILPRAPAGISVRDWLLAWHLPADTPPAAAASGVSSMVLQRWRGEERLFDAARVRLLSQQLLNQIAQHHREVPNESGMAISDLLTGLPVIERPTMATLTLERLIAQGLLRRYGDRLALPDHVPRTDPENERLWSQLEPLLSQDRSASVHEIAERLACSAEYIISALERQARLGRVVRVAANRYLTLQRFESLLEQARLLATQERLSAAEFNRTTGLGRNLTIEVLETFDRLRFTRRRGSLRVLPLG
ncbi:MAG: selenocysteine-specific translation factor [Pseudomonadota bacterium]